MGKTAALHTEMKLYFMNTIIQNPKIVFTNEESSDKL